MKPILAQRLRAARQSIYPVITQREVAKRLKRSPSAINLWEAGHTQPSAEDLAELARWFNVSTDWLLGVEAIKSPRATARPPIHTVPVVDPVAMVRWRWDVVTELLQTAVAYPVNTAAGMVVASDALTSTCPTGCYAVVSKGHGIRHGAVVLASLRRSMDTILRKYIKEGRDELLVADDTRFPTYRLDDGVNIIGRVTEVTVRRMIS